MYIYIYTYVYIYIYTHIIIYYIYKYIAYLIAEPPVVGVNGGEQRRQRDIDPSVYLPIYSEILIDLCVYLSIFISLHVECVEKSINYGILFIFSLVYENNNLEYEHVPA